MNILTKILGTIAFSAMLMAGAPLMLEASAQSSHDAAAITLLPDQNITVVSFGNGVAQVTASDRADLKKVADLAKDKAKVTRLVVAAWSDKPFPETKSDSLTREDRKLANDRAASVKSALKDLGAPKISTHSMAVHPGWIANAFNTRDAKLKGEGRIKDWNDVVVSKIGAQLRDKGGPGKVVVVVIRAPEAVAH